MTWSVNQKMKYILIIWICSFGAERPHCGPGLTYPVKFDSWYDCTQTALTESGKIMSQMGQSRVDEHKLAIKFACRKAPPTI